MRREQHLPVAQPPGGFRDRGQRSSPSETGPSRRYFFLTDLGRELLIRFISRNILVFEQPDVAELIQKTLSSNGKQKG